MRLAVPAFAAALFASPLAAQDFDAAMRAFLEDEVRAWATAPVLVEAIRTMNTSRAGMDQARIDALDAAWRAEIGAGDTPTITPILENAAADFLRERVEASGGRITEVFVMGAHGLNVAASGLTSDMWQGDEAKFEETYGAGVRAVHVGEIELDESTQRYQGQVSLTIADPDTGEAIGAMTVGIDAESLL